MPRSRPITACYLSPVSGPGTLPEWVTYVASPSRSTFQALVVACDGAGCRSELVAALGHEFTKSQNWRVAQHAAIEAWEARFMTLAHYWVHQAMILSAGHVLARLVLTDILWGRRLAAGVLYQTEIIRKLARRTSPHADRRFLQLRVAAFSARSLAYGGDVEGADRWFRLLEFTRKVDVETALRLLFGARQRGNDRVRARAALALAPVHAQLGGRARHAVQSGVRVALVRVIRARVTMK